MNYKQVLNYLYNQLPMFTRIGASAYKKDLKNTLALCEIIGNPHTSFKTIHVAGTNGKGSTSHMLASVLQEAGYKVGLYTSPHLRDFRERIKINGNMIAEQDVIDFVEQYQSAFEKIAPSFFEWTVALAFNHFALNKVDVAVIETGLGGRLDSTNIINPELSIITNIGWDHTDMLGNTLPEIAIEKAGIIKPNKPVVIGEFHAETYPVFEKIASEKNAKLYSAFNEVELTLIEKKQEENCFYIKYANGSLEDIVCTDLLGNYQSNNIKTVLTALRVLQLLKYNISTDDIKNGLQHVKSNTGLLGRWQVLQRNPLVVADTGHNSNGIAYIVEQIAEQKFKNLHFVLGMVKDKDCNKVLKLLPKNAVYYFTNANIPRALPAIELASVASEHGLLGNVFPSVADAIKAALTKAEKDDMIFIGGSTYIVAEAV